MTLKGIKMFFAPTTTKKDKDPALAGGFFVT